MGKVMVWEEKGRGGGEAEKGKGWRREGEMWHREWDGRDMTWDRIGRKGKKAKEREEMGYSPQISIPGAASADLDPHFVNPGSAPVCYL